MTRFARCGRRAAVLSVGLVVLGPAALVAQDGPTLIRQGVQAYNDFETARALSLLRRGLNPSAGPQDALWAQGVQFLAQALFDEGQVADVVTWARWAMRIAPTMTIDTLNLVSDVIAAFQTARSETAPGPSDVATTTTWRWPAADPGTGPGNLEIVPPDLPVAVTVLVVGRGVLQPGVSIRVPAGSYQIEVSAQGYQAIQVTREVLPGVTTVLGFDLQPTPVAVAADVLPDPVRTTALSQVVSLTVHRFGTAPTCGAGALVGRDGLLLTTYRAVRGADSVVVTLADRQVTSGVRVAAHDVSTDLAVLKAPLVRGDSLPLASAITNNQYVWGFGFQDCASPSDRRLQIARWEGRPGGRLVLTDSLVDAVFGSPVIDQQGAVVGLWTAPVSAVPGARANSVMNDARRRVADQQVRTFAQVADQENHRYGSVAITSTATGALARVTSLDRTWPELEQSSFVPFTYAGPQGRYRVELRVNGVLRREMDFVIRAAVADQLAVDPEGPAAPAQVAQERGGGFPWIIAVLGGGGAAAVAALVLGGGGNGPRTDTETGSIRIRFPDP